MAIHQITRDSWKYLTKSLGKDATALMGAASYLFPWISVNFYKGLAQP